MLEKALFRAALVVLLPCGLFAQAPEQLQFDVATVKPTPLVDHRPTLGPSDAGRVTFRMTLRRLLLTAYGISGEQLAGPAWLDDTSFDIVAKMAEGSTIEQVDVMLQHLLTERFKMVLHHEMQDKAAYELTIAKTGLKLKETEYPNAKRASSDSMEFSLDKNNFPVLPKDLAVETKINWVKKENIHSTFRSYPFPRLVEDLEGILTTMIEVSDDPTRTFAARVIDKTGLTGRYDFTLEYAGLNDDANGPGIATALEKQLGLKLEKIKAPLDVIVIDHIEKTPVEN